MNSRINKNNFGQPLVKTKKFLKPLATWSIEKCLLLGCKVCELFRLFGLENERPVKDCVPARETREFKNVSDLLNNPSTNIKEIFDLLYI